MISKFTLLYNSLVFVCFETRAVPKPESLVPGTDSPFLIILSFLEHSVAKFLSLETVLRKVDVISSFKFVSETVITVLSFVTARKNAPFLLLKPFMFCI